MHTALCLMSIQLQKNVKIKLVISGKVLQTYWRTTQLEYTWLRSLMKRHKDFWQVTEDSLDKSMKAYEIDPSMKDELLRSL